MEKCEATPVETSTIPEEKALSNVSGEIDETLRRSGAVIDKIEALQQQWSSYENTMNTLNHRFLQTVLPQYGALKSQLQNDSLLEGAVSMSLDRVSGTGDTPGSASTLQWAENLVKQQDEIELMAGIQASLADEPEKQASTEEDDDEDALLALALQMSREKPLGNEAEDENEALQQALQMSLGAIDVLSEEENEDSGRGIRVNEGVEESKC